MTDEKILTEEKLEEEQLDQVVGGTMWEIEDDIKRFKELGVLSDGVDKHDKDAFKKAFAVYGIKAERGWFGADNEYFLGGRKISREEAWAEVRVQAKTFCPQVK